MRCFVHFDFQMCFSPQLPAIFRHLNRQKCSEAVMFCIFSLANVLFRHSGMQFFDIWTDKSAPRPSCFVHFWLSNVLFATAACNFRFRLWALTSAPAALTGLLFDWPNRRIIEKTQHFATSLTFGRGCIFFLLTFALLHLLSTDLATLLRSYASAFQLSILSEVSI